MCHVALQPVLYGRLVLAQVKEGLEENRMCGIAGQVTDKTNSIDRHRIAAMGACLRHRGPDDAGVYVQGSVGLAHQRLSILDLSTAGHQPMSNEDGTVWIVFNGEIYNFEELRTRLTDRHIFRSRTDTEVLVHLYEEFGPDCVTMLRGMFAFAIWDSRIRRLVLGRDRLGKKPLYYSESRGTLTFASELKALMVGCPQHDIDPVALHHYLTFQYVPGPRSIFSGIKKLQPGHMLVWEDGKVSERAYWSLSFRKRRVALSDQGCQEEFLALLRESTRLRLVSDVPLGAFLSGGMDSSTVVALMSQLTNRPVKTFSIGFKEDAFNELPYAREVAKHLGTEHHEFIVEPSAVDILPTLARVFDEPFADSSAIPTYYVSQLSRQFVTVIVNGDGGDELLGGYPRYDAVLCDRLLARAFSMATQDSIASVIGRFPARGAMLAKIKDRVQRLFQPFSHTYLGRICFFGPEEKEELYTEGFHDKVKDDDSLALLNEWFEQIQASDLLDRMAGVDTMSYLPDDLLVKVDRATMAHGLEARSPLLDHHLVEFCASLPVDFKIRGGVTKYLLKAVMKDTLPSSILQRPKMGFGVPIDQWFRGECREIVEDTLLSSRCLQRGYFEPAKIRRMVHEQQQGRTSYGSRVYALLMLELWHQQYMDKTGWAQMDWAGQHAIA
jgi:asparagine synthase (glutamine-hydrolysing)